MEAAVDRPKLQTRAESYVRTIPRNFGWRRIPYGRPKRIPGWRSGGIRSLTRAPAIASRPSHQGRALRSQPPAIRHLISGRPSCPQSMSHNGPITTTRPHPRAATNSPPPLTGRLKLYPSASKRHWTPRTWRILALFSALLIRSFVPAPLPRVGNV